MFESAIVVPAKVTRCALENAALFLTTEVLVVDKTAE